VKLDERWPVGSAQLVQRDAAVSLLQLGSAAGLEDILRYLGEAVRDHARDNEMEAVLDKLGDAALRSGPQPRLVRALEAFNPASPSLAERVRKVLERWRSL
jgi:hypothetical protein